MATMMEELQRMLQRMTPAEQEALLRQNFSNIGTPVPGPVDPNRGDGEAIRPFYTTDRVQELTSLPSGSFIGSIGMPFDQAGPGGQYGQYFGTYSPAGELQQLQFAPLQRSGSWLSENPVAALAIPLLAAGGYAALGGTFGGAGAGAAAGSGAAAGGGFTGGGASFSNLFTPELMSGAIGTTPISAGAPVLLADGTVAAGGSTLAGNGLAVPAGAGASLGGGTSLANAAGAGTAAGAGAAATPVAAGSTLLNTLGGARGAAALLGAAAGAAGSGSTTATQSTTVPEELRPFSQDIAERGQRFADQPFQPFTGQRFAGPNDALRNAWEMVNQASRAPTTQQTQAEAAFARLLQGNSPNLANAERAANPFLGATTPNATNAYLGSSVNSNVSALARDNANPFIGREVAPITAGGQMSLPTSTTAIGNNSLRGLSNPYMQAAINQTVDDITRNFNNVVNPQFDRLGRASGSFGNTGVEQMRLEAQRNLAREIGRASTDLRMKDYDTQANLEEAELNRQAKVALADAERNQAARQAEQSFNLGAELARQQTNAQLAQTDLARNLAATSQQNAQLLNAAQFDVSQNAADLSRNAQLAQNLGQFNASLGQSDLSRNAQLAQNMGQFNAQQGNFDITNQANMYNAAQNRAAGTLGQWQGFAEQPFRNANALGTVGSQMNAFAQQPLDFNFQQYQAQQQDPYNRLGLYGNLYGAARGGQSQTSTTGGGNTAAGLLGGAVTGLGLYNLFNQPNQTNQPPRY